MPLLRGRIVAVGKLISSNGSLTYSKISGALEIDSQMAGLPDLVLKVLGANGIDDIGYDSAIMPPNLL